MGKIWEGDGGIFIVETEKKDGLMYGCLVNSKAGKAWPEQPVQSIIHMSPMVNFQEYKGDPAPLLALVQAKGGAS